MACVTKVASNFFIDLKLANTCYQKLLDLTKTQQFPHKHNGHSTVHHRCNKIQDVFPGTKSNLRSMLTTFSNAFSMKKIFVS